MSSVLPHARMAGQFTLCGSSDHCCCIIWAGWPHCLPPPQDTCSAKQGCVWCISAAVRSACYTGGWLRGHGCVEKGCASWPGMAGASALGLPANCMCQLHGFTYHCLHSCGLQPAPRHPLGAAFNTPPPYPCCTWLQRRRPSACPPPCSAASSPAWRRSSEDGWRHNASQQAWHCARS